MNKEQQKNYTIIIIGLNVLSFFCVSRWWLIATIPITLAYFILREESDFIKFSKLFFGVIVANFAVILLEFPFLVWLITFVISIITVLIASNSNYEEEAYKQKDSNHIREQQNEVAPKTDFTTFQQSQQRNYSPNNSSNVRTQQNRYNPSPKRQNTSSYNNSTKYNPSYNTYSIQNSSNEYFDKFKEGFTDGFKESAEEKLKQRFGIEQNESYSSDDYADDYTDYSNHTNYTNNTSKSQSYYNEPQNNYSRRTYNDGYNNTNSYDYHNEYSNGTNIGSDSYSSHSYDDGDDNLFDD